MLSFSKIDKVLLVLIGLAIVGFGVGFVLLANSGSQWQPSTEIKTQISTCRMVAEASRDDLYIESNYKADDLPEVVDRGRRVRALIFMCMDGEEFSEEGLQKRIEELKIAEERDV